MKLVNTTQHLSCCGFEFHLEYFKGEWCNGSHTSLRNWCLVRAGSNPASPMNKLQYDGKQFRSFKRCYPLG